jgi:hypothetical protein
MVYFGVQSYRDNVAGGSITFGRAFNVGLLISLVIMACYVVVWEVTYYNFMPDYLDHFAAQAEEMRSFGEMYKNNILINIAFTLLEPLPVALVFTLLTAGIASRKRSPQGTVAALS